MVRVAALVTPEGRPARALLRLRLTVSSPSTRVSSTTRIVDGFEDLSRGKRYGLGHIGIVCNIRRRTVGYSQGQPKPRHHSRLYAPRVMVASVPSSDTVIAGGIKGNDAG